MISGGSLIQKVKHELINPLPGKPPRYDNIIIMVGEDRKDLTMPAALMKAVNKFSGYEHVKVTLDVTPRGTGISGTALRNSLKNDSPEQALATWSNAFDVNKLGEDWIKHLMDITRKGMGLKEPAVESTINNILNNINHQDINEIKSVVMQGNNKFRTLQYELHKRNIKVGQAMHEAIKTGLRIL